MNAFNFILAGICFAIWQLVMRKSGLTSDGQTLILTLLTTAVITIFFSIKRFIGQSGGLSEIVTILAVAGIFYSALFGKGIIGSPPLLAASIAGALNGLGTIKFIEGMNSVPKQNVAGLIIAMVMCQIITTAVGGVAFLGAEITPKNLLGFLMASGAIYFLIA